MPRPIVPDDDLLSRAESGDIEGTEEQEIDGLNNEGQPRKLHHFKAKKVFVKGSARGPKQPATPAEIAAYKARGNPNG